MVATNEMLKPIMVNKGIKQADISSQLSFPKSLVSKFFAGNTSTEFGNVLAIVKYVAPADFLRIMRDHCLSLTKTSQIQDAIEFASTYRQGELLRELLAVHADDRKFADWVMVYNLALDVDTKAISYEDALDRCREVYGSLSSIELKSKVDVIESIAQYELGYLDSVANLLAKSNVRVESLKDRFIKESIQGRLNLLTAYTLLYNKNDAKGAESAALKVAKSQASPCKMVASAYYTIGHANMFDNVEKSMEYFGKAERLFREIGEEAIADGILTHDIPFANNANGLDFDASEACVEERAHRLIISGEHKKASELLSSVEESCYTKVYQGKLSKDIGKLMEAYNQLLKSGENFFLRFVIRELSVLGLKLN